MADPTTLRRAPRRAPSWHKMVVVVVLLAAAGPPAPPTPRAPRGRPSPPTPTGTTATVPAFDRGRFAAVIPIPGAGSLAVAKGKLWVLDAVSTVVPIDLRTNAVVGRPLRVPANVEWPGSTRRPTGWRAGRSRPATAPKAWPPVAGRCGSPTTTPPLLRARIVGRSWDGQRVAEIATALGCQPKTVRQWLHRFNERGVGGLGDLPRSGRPRRLGETERGQLIALVRQAPPGRLVRQADGALAAEHDQQPAQRTLDA
jgi:hypothetical protein